MLDDAPSPGVSLLCSHLGNRTIFVLDGSRYLNRDVRYIAVASQSLCPTGRSIRDFGLVTCMQNAWGVTRKRGFSL